MVEEILNTRLMVKKAMKEYKNDAVSGGYILLLSHYFVTVLFLIQYITLTVCIGTASMYLSIDRACSGYCTLVSLV